MRNLVIHAYFAIDLKVVWTTVRNDLPALKQQIDELLNEERNRPHGSERAPDEGSRPRGDSVQIVLQIGLSVSR
jgi:hypothetical protein